MQPTQRPIFSAVFFNLIADSINYLAKWFFFYFSEEKSVFLQRRSLLALRLF